MDQNRELLTAVVDRIIPADHDPGALGLGTDRYVLAFLAANETDGMLIRAGLENLAAHCPDFVRLAAFDQDRVLEAHEAEVWFSRLVGITSEGLYADPDNGGNAGAGSWSMIGYRHGLPDGPSGP